MHHINVNERHQISMVATQLSWNKITYRLICYNKVKSEMQLGHLHRIPNLRNTNTSVIQYKPDGKSFKKDKKFKKLLFLILHAHF